LGQRTRILTQLFGFDGWRVTEAYLEDAEGKKVNPVGAYVPPPEVRLVVRMERKWMACCSECGARCRKLHDKVSIRRPVP
jgi:hypothetical protein